MKLLPVPAQGRIKIKSPKHSVLAQRALIAAGVCCVYKVNEVRNIEKPYLYIRDGRITYGTTKNYFRATDLPEYTFDGVNFTKYVPTPKTEEPVTKCLYSLKVPKYLRRGYTAAVTENPLGMMDLIRHLGKAVGDLPGTGTGFESIVNTRHEPHGMFVEYDYVDDHGVTCTGKMRILRHPVV